MWEDGVRLIRQHPWFGVGMDTVVNHWQEWNIRGFTKYRVQSHFHSTPITDRGGARPTHAGSMAVVRRGLPDFSVSPAAKARARSRFATAVVTAVLAAFVAYLATSLVQYCLGDDPLVMILFFYFGLAIAIDRMLKTPGALDVE